MGEIIQEEPEVKTFQTRLKKAIKKRLPILGWLPKYTKSDLISDVIAGVAVGLTLVPQSMAYAGISGLTPEYGLYSSYLACFIYVIFGSCRQAAIGPTAIMSLLTFQTCGFNNAPCVILLSFYKGCFELLMAALSLGWVISFISEPVTIGFTAGASLTILSSQIKSLFGIGGDKGSDFIEYWKAIFRDISQIHLADSILGVFCVFVLLALRKLKDLPISNPTPKLKYTLWLISTARNIIVVVITTLLAFSWGTPPFKIVGKVEGGIPPFSIPEFLLPDLSGSRNETDNNEITTLSFVESWKYLSTGPLVIAIIAVLQNVAISKAFGAGQSIDGTQEMFALGVCDIFGSFLSTVPVSGAFSRSAVNEASGVRTPMGGLFTGLLVILALSFLTPSFYYIPTASLAAVIISAVYFMIEYDALKPMWKISKVDFVVCIITFLVSLYFGMEFGILVGIALSILHLLIKSLRPKIHQELRSEDGILYYTITPDDAGLVFPSVDFVRTYLNNLALKRKNIDTFILNFEKWNQYDYTSANALASLVKGFKKNNKSLQFMNCSNEWLIALQIAGLSSSPIISVEEIGEFLKKNTSNVVAIQMNEILKPEQNGHSIDGQVK